MQKTNRVWGHYKVLYEGDGFAVKELVIDSGKSLSDQYHEHRSEHWLCVSGTVTIKLEARADCGLRIRKKVSLKPGESVDIPKNCWHKATNPIAEPAHIVEVWRGNILTEDDINRRD